MIGAVFPLSAGAGRIGEMKRQGADLAVKHLNAAGGIAGRPLEVRYVDSRNQVGDARTGFDKLLDVDQVPVVMSAMSQVSLALVPVAERRQVVLFANASHPELTKNHPYVFRNLPSTGKTATAMAKAASERLKLKRVAVVWLNDEYGAEAKRLFGETFKAAGGTLVGDEPFARDAQDVRTQLGKLAALKPDGWWIPGYGQALGLVLKQKAELHIAGQVLSDLGIVDQNVLTTAGDGANGAAVVSPAFDPDSPAANVRRFVSDFRAAHNAPPSFDAAFQYDAVGLLARALTQTKGAGGPALREALASIKDYPGVCGPTSFGAGGDADMPVVVRRLADFRLVGLD